MAELMSVLRTKVLPGRPWLLGRGGAALGVRPANRIARIDGHARDNGASSNASPPSRRGAILPVEATVSDEFATRLGGWLADVAMNRQGAA